MTQVRLTIELGVTQETISAYEIGKHYPSVSNLIKMTVLFDCSLDYIIGLSDLRKSIREKSLPNDEVYLLSIYRELGENQKDKVVAFIQGLLT